MINLPVNTPTKYSNNKALKVWVMGEPGSGKTTFASTFPAPLLISTDGNYTEFTMPVITLQSTMVGYNQRGQKQNITGLNFLKELVQELTTTNSRNYQTVIFDLFEDVYRIIDESVAMSYGKRYASEIGFGKAVREVKDEVKDLLTKLNESNLNVVLLSHTVKTQIAITNTESLTLWTPRDLKDDVVAMVGGRVKLMAMLEVRSEVVRDQRNLAVVENGQFKMKYFRILNWEKTPLTPSVFSRYANAMAFSCLPTYKDLRQTLNIT